MDDKQKQFEADCIYWRGVILTGKYKHWCYDWDGLPVDETCLEEWLSCNCFVNDDNNKKD